MKLPFSVTASWVVAPMIISFGWKQFSGYRKLRKYLGWLKVERWGNLLGWFYHIIPRFPSKIVIFHRQVSLPQGTSNARPVGRTPRGRIIRCFVPPPTLSGPSTSNRRGEAQGAEDLGTAQEISGWSGCCHVEIPGHQGEPHGKRLPETFSASNCWGNRSLSNEIRDANAWITMVGHAS